jgi:hypothetical protein
MTFEDWLNAYYETFGKNYPLVIVGEKSEAEIIGDISRCIESGVPADDPVYEDGLIY